MTKPKPFIKWVGGKTKLLPQLTPLLPPSFNTYHEPFLGGGAMFFHLWNEGKLKPQGYAQLSDSNTLLIHTYRMVRSFPDELITRLGEYQAKHSPEFYYEVRDGLNNHTIIVNVDRAAAFIYLNKTGFNGLYRENLQGKINMAIGSYKNPCICDPDTILAASQALDSTILFRESVGRRSPKAGDFVYLDPPYYPVSASSNFVGYQRHGFTEQDHRKLLQRFDEWASKGVHVMLSNSDCEFTRELYGSSQYAKVHTATTGRSINSKGDRRGKVTELVVTSY
jgi:DNA adenine methylase